MSRLGLLLLVSGPSGSGKTTLCGRLAAEGLARYATSATTRPPRPGETHGQDYFFLSEEDFLSRREAGDFLENALVHDHHYGTLKSEVNEHLTQGQDVVIDIDVQGAHTVRQTDDPILQRALVDLFVMPPDKAELRTRLTGRGTDSPEIIERRMKNALAEMAAWPQYTYRLVSSTREDDYLQLKSLLLAERLRTTRLTP